MPDYSRQQLLEFGKQAFNDSLSVSRTVRKTLYKNNIWRPQNLCLYKPLNYKTDTRKHTVNGASGGVLNAHSVNEKELVISELITDNHLSFLVLTETWWSSIDDKSTVSRGFITPDGYNLRHAPRPTGTGGGVGLIFKESFNVK